LEQSFLLRGGYWISELNWDLALTRILISNYTILKEYHKQSENNRCRGMIEQDKS